MASFDPHTPLNEVIEGLASQRTGLSEKEAESRLRTHGPNALPEPKVPGTFSIFISQFLSPLVYILLVAAVVVWWMGEVADAVIIFFVLLFNAIVGTIQEGKAQNTLLALRTYSQGSAVVMRDGKETVISDRNLVPGDVIVLREGEKVPADSRILSARSLRADESMLTGESVPVGKTADELPQATLQIQDQRNTLFKGTNIVGGTGEAMVTATGVNTQIGKISQSIASIDADLPLKRNIKFLSRGIIVIVAIIAAVIFGLGLARGEPLDVIFATVVSLSVSIIPEGLPIVMTLVLASGVWRMSKQNVLVKKLQAVEGLGQAKIIAVDKTGTLTKNEMVLEKVFINRATYEISGAGYEPKGAISLEGKTIDPLNFPDLLLVGRIAHFCANAEAMYMEKEKIWKVSGDPTEAAMGVFAKKIGFKEFQEASARTFDLPFDYKTKYHLTIHELKGKNVLTVVGAPEKLIELSRFVWHGRSVKLLTEEKRELESAFSKFSESGYRVLACAMHQDSGAVLPGDDLPPLTFVGFFAMRDALRPEAKEAINRARHAGIRVVMITGDHVITAMAIAKDAGIDFSTKYILTGEDLLRLSDDDLAERFEMCNIFARVAPDQKLKIIQIFKKRGEVVAMTGDGVNDASSLAAADLGVAMGKIGTEVAKEAADLVLLDDDFGNIVSAVEEGRSIYKTVRKVILYLFSTSIGEAGTILGAIFLGLPLPVLPVQIIWLNFVTDGFLDVALANEPKEDALLNGSFQKPSKYVLNLFSVGRMFFMGLVIAIGTLFIFGFYLENGAEKALTVSLTTLAIFQWFNAWNCKNENRSLFRTNPFNNPFLVGATVIVVCLQFLAVYYPPLQRFLHTVPLAMIDWVYIVAVSGSVLVLEELRKLVMRPRL